MNPPPFVAIDFETADYGRDSACSVGLVRVEGGRVVDRVVKLVRPPRQDVYFTYIHGITWERVRDQPVWSDVWRSVRGILDGAEFLAAHNASFDKGVLNACCDRAGMPAPSQDFVCTVRIAREQWALKPANLPAVCRHLAIKLNHHEALSDAEACAQIVVAAWQDGWRPMPKKWRALAHG